MDTFLMINEALSGGRLVSPSERALNDAHYEGCNRNPYVILSNPWREYEAKFNFIMADRYQEPDNLPCS